VSKGKRSQAGFDRWFEQGDDSTSEDQLYCDMDIVDRRTKRSFHKKGEGALQSEFANWMHDK